MQGDGTVAKLVCRILHCDYLVDDLIKDTVLVGSVNRLVKRVGRVRRKVERG